jgi:hypothetical protein
MTTKFALINTFPALPDHLGQVISFHRTEEAAEKANASLQKAIKRANGNSSYLPTIIREVDSKAKKCQNLHTSWTA